MHPGDQGDPFVARHAPQPRGAVDVAQRMAASIGEGTRVAGVVQRTQYLPVVERAPTLIRATRYLSPIANAQADRFDGLDLMLDIDLAILGADRARFEEYERQVRLEYAHVPDEAFARARADFVEAMLGTSPLFRTELARAELEARARDNLQRSLRNWRRASSVRAATSKPACSATHAVSGAAALNTLQRSRIDR